MRRCARYLSTGGACYKRQPGDLTNEVHELPRKFFSKPRPAGLENSGRSSRGAGEKKMDTGVPGHRGSRLLWSATWNRPLDHDTRRSLQRQRGASGTRRLVVSMMQIDPTPFGVGD